MVKPFHDIGPRRLRSLPTYTEMCERQHWVTYDISRIYICGKIRNGVYDGGLSRLLRHLADVRGQKPVETMAINGVAWSAFGEDRSEYHTALMSFPTIKKLFLDNVTCSQNEFVTLLSSYSHLTIISIEGVTFDDFPIVYNRIPGRLNPSVSSLTLHLDNSSTPLLRFLMAQNRPFSLSSVNCLEISGLNNPIPGTKDLFANLAPVIARPREITFRCIAMHEELPALKMPYVSNLTFTLVLDRRRDYIHSIKWWAKTLSHPSSLWNLKIRIDSNASLSDRDHPYWTDLDNALWMNNLSRLHVQISLGYSIIQSCVLVGMAVRSRLPRATHQHGSLGRLAWLNEEGNMLDLD
ncbi:uncharacterized protein BT62DRAFT_249216 [Guyanagaster necrorhizus]|uniref:Uncharacterized protein n=1 Tax=Guyanagaster necrorhizus TaxID=856835 RepID=A0A9P8AQF2_9AGAR|nr:uncharacterized protein BT62DRAFT_249216 [Guyanagaster necrorhizus MCA 3950]KAG7444049.1 hypothetical protein BT62DRAFT_249216 [Guyanagaster necrorhizus MCA 3950]